MADDADVRVSRDDRIGPRAGLFLLLALVVALVYTITERPYRNGPPIRSDGVGYHFWTYALKQGDLSFCQYQDALLPVRALAATETATGRCQIKYPPGVALVQMPVVYWAIPRHGSTVTEAQHRAVLVLGALLLLSVAILSYLTGRRLGAASAAAVIGTGAFVCGTGLFHYATYDASFSHIYSAAFVSMAMWLAALPEGQRASRAVLVLFGACVLELSLVRHTNALISGALALMLWERNGRSAGPLIAWTAAEVGALTVQLGYNAYATGMWTLSSYGPESFVSFGGHARDVLVSWERGLFTYYPVFAVTIALGLWKGRGPLVYGFVLLVLGYALLYGSWWVWHLAGGMGHRGFVELGPLGAVVLAMALSRTGHDLRMVTYAALALSVYTTVSVMLAYWSGQFPFGGASYREYLSALRLIQP